MMSPSPAIEPIRVANRLLGRPAFEWSTSSIDGRASIASNGLPLAAERIEDVISRTDAMILCGGTRLPEADEGPIIRTLRQAAHRHLVIGGYRRPHICWPKQVCWTVTAAPSTGKTCLRCARTFPS
ncbi:hypothetical protein [Paracoccus yeei]|uniref:hypothetical protein n=1 Tax=Paracoccus yeei TaxID=147645 RepID=UPI001C8DCD2B|nr:hypothetical protein [Paracoccus yeei]